MNYYELLEIPTTASIEDIKKAYHRSVLQWHPDKNPNNKSVAEEKFRQIYRAREVLCDPVTKKRYDDLMGFRTNHKAEEIKASQPNVNNSSLQALRQSIERKLPGALDTFKNDNAIVMIKRCKFLSGDEIAFLWTHVIQNHNKVISEINLLHELELTSLALQKIHHSAIFLDYRKKLFELKVPQQCIHTMDDLIKVLDSFNHYFGEDLQAIVYKRTLLEEYRDRYSTLLQNGVSEINKNMALQLLYSLNEEELVKAVRENRTIFLKFFSNNDAAKGVEKWLVIAKELFPKQNPYRMFLKDFWNSPLVSTLFVLKNAPVEILLEFISDIRAYLVPIGGKNKNYWSKFMDSFFKRLCVSEFSEELVRLFYASFFQIKHSVRAKFLAVIEKNMGSNSIEFLVYSAWQKYTYAERGLAMKAIPFSYEQLTFLSKLGSGIPVIEMLILANAIIKSPQILNGVLSLTACYPLLPPPEYKKIFNTIESHVIHLSQLRDSFIQMLDEKILYYKQHDSENFDNESRKLYENMADIFTTERNQYVVSKRDDAAKQLCRHAIKVKIYELKTTSAINENMAASLNRVVHSVGAAFGLCNAQDVTTKTSVSQNIYAFMRSPNTLIVKDIVEACELKNAF